MRVIQIIRLAFLSLPFLFLFISKSYSQCYSANAGSDVTICSGGATIGTSAISGYTYSWSPATGLSNPNIAQPTANPGSTTTYTLTMTTNSTNLMQDGDFESGDLESYYSSDYISLGEGGLGYFASAGWSNSGCSMYPHAGNLAFYGAGPDPSLYPNFRAIYQTINVSTNTGYNFSGFVANGPGGNAISIKVRLVGNIIGTTTSNFSSSGTCNVWTPFSMNWNSGSNTQVTIEIISNEDQYVEFCLDDLTFRECQTTTDQVTVFKSTATPSISPAGPVTYYNHYEHTGIYVLTASSSGTYQWYKNNVLITGATNQTYAIPISGLGSYTDYYKCVNACGTSNTVTFNYVGCTTNSGYPVSVPTGGCMSDLTTLPGVTLPTYSLGSGTTYSHSLEYSPTCLLIGPGNYVRASGCTQSEGNFIVSKSIKGTEELLMGYYFTGDNGCRMAVGGGNNGPIKELGPPRWKDDETYITPNPATLAVTIRSKEPLSKIEFFSTSGILMKTHGANKLSIITIDVSDLKPGVYMVKLIGASGTETKKLLVQ